MSQPFRLVPIGDVCRDPDCPHYAMPDYPHSHWQQDEPPEPPPRPPSLPARIRAWFGPQPAYRAPRLP